MMSNIIKDKAKNVFQHSFHEAKKDISDNNNQIHSKLEAKCDIKWTKTWYNFDITLLHGDRLFSSNSSTDLTSNFLLVKTTYGRAIPSSKKPGDL